LLVNRGWIPQGDKDSVRELVRVPDTPLQIHGRVGQLPRAGMRMGGAFEGSSGWPRHAVYPTREEVSSLLSEDLEPFVLLLDAEDRFGFRRDWEPEEMSASRHFGYAFQWFAMAAMLSGLLVYYYRKRTRA
jgi:cytochrome oxidase assembly protein ShyY1